MPFPMKIQPIDAAEGNRLELVIKPVVKSRLKRLLERPFSGVLRNSAAEKTGGGGGQEPLQIQCKEGINGSTDFEPSSACLAKMVQSYIEENHEKSSAPVRCGGRNCFNRICDDSSDDESVFNGGSGEWNYPSGDASEILKGLVACGSVGERNLLADTAKIVEKNKICKRKDSSCRKVVTEGLVALGYDASICKSRWEKSPSYPAGEYEYIDVMMGNGERVLIDIDFRSEFEIARSTKAYKTILQNLPYIFVGKCDQLQSIVALVSEAAKQSLRKKGMHVPPWRRVEYVKAKWLSPYSRTTTAINEEEKEKQQVLKEKEESPVAVDVAETVVSGGDGAVAEWKPPELKPKGSLSGVKVVTGLAVVFDDDN